MPAVVSRWQSVASKNPWFASEANEATACGAWTPSSDIPMVPKFVSMVTSHTRD